MCVCQSVWKTYKACTINYCCDGSMLLAQWLMACSDILWMQACGVRLIAFTATWTERAFLPLSIQGNLCPFMIYTRQRKKHCSQNMYKLLLDFDYLCHIGEPSGWTPRGRHTGDHPWHESRFGLLRHGGQCGGGRCEVYPRRGWVHHRWAVSHTNNMRIVILKLLLLLCADWQLHQLQQCSFSYLYYSKTQYFT